MSIDSPDVCPSCGGDTAYDADEVEHCSACGLNIDDYIDEFGDDDRTSEVDEYDFTAEAD
jgi:hypothetical protein